jgi:hypothetical protein
MLKISNFGQTKYSKTVDNNLPFCYNMSMLRNWHTKTLTLGNLERQLKMATEKLFTVAGTATNPDGTTKARFANDMVARVKILTKAKCSNVNLVELPRAMTKLEALQFLQETGVTGDAGYAVANKLAEKTKIAKRAEIKVAVKPEAIKAKASAKVADRA